MKTYSEPAVSVLGLNFLPVRHPVTIPSPKSGRVVNTNGIDVLDLETSTLELVDEPAQRRRGVSTWEDVLVHEKSPSQVLVLPRLPETSDLKEEDTIILKHVVDLA